ncbi:MAG: hypothetical protein LBF15_04345 [Candidatus Peribacteria bacterium]|nr:hypothetical protein [Candidatus Peribacteria bacterium]
MSVALQLGFALAVVVGICHAPVVHNSIGISQFGRIQVLPLWIYHVLHLSVSVSQFQVKVQLLHVNVCLNSKYPFNHHQDKLHVLVRVAVVFQ